LQVSLNNNLFTYSDFENRKDEIRNKLYKKYANIGIFASRASTLSVGHKAGHGIVKTTTLTVAFFSKLLGTTKWLILVYLGQLL